MRRRLPALCLLATFLLVGCRTINADGGASIVWHGVRYVGGGSAGFRVEHADVTPIGDANSTSPPAAGTTVYAIAGVDAALVVAMKAAEGQSLYVLFFRDGLTPPFSEAVPGLCAYLDANPTGECP